MKMIKLPRPDKIIKRLFKLINFFQKNPIFTPSEKDSLTRAFLISKNNIPLELKLKTFFLLKKLKTRRRRPFGIIIILGWNSKWNKLHTSIPDIRQNIFKQGRFDLTRASEKNTLAKLSSIAGFDGAILISPTGLILASGVYLEKMAPKLVAKKISPVRSEDLSAAFGFLRKVHSRHLVAIAASYRLKGTTVFVVSEEVGSIHIFEDGKIIYSTLVKEMK